MSLFSIPLLFLGLLCLWPWVRRYLLPDPDQRVLALAAGFGLSVGGLTLWMLLLGLLPGRALSPLAVLLFPAATLLIGLQSLISARHSQSPGRPPRYGRGEWWLLLAVAGSLAVSLAHSLYYPFVGEDELSRYAYFARLIFEARSIPATVSGYPLLLPLGYAYAFFVGGGLDQHLAKVVSWMFAPATVAATYYLASLWAGRRAGLVAAFTLTVSRLFVDWSPMGYVDIPTGLYAALTGVFASLWLQRRELRFAIAAGLAAGLAAWAKQSGFASLFSLGLVFGAAGAFGGERRMVWRRAAVAVGFAALVALPWYARNAALDGWQNAAPSVSDYYYAQARRSLLDWIPFLSWAAEIGYGVAPLYVGGLLAGAAVLWRDATRPRSANLPPQSDAGSRITFYVSGFAASAGLLLQAAFILPYLALWWAFFSYEPRFLLTVLPFYAALAGLGFEWLAARVRLRLHSLVVALLSAALLAGGVYTRLGGLYRLAVAPFATDEERLLHYKPDVASTVAFVRQNAAPGLDRIYSMDPRLNFHLADYDLTVGYPTELAQLDGYEYLIAGSWAFNKVYPGLGQTDNEIAAHLEDAGVFELLFTSELGTVKVYRVLRPSSQAIR